MVKKLLTFIMGLGLAFGASAQMGPGNPVVPQDSIRFWTGTGENRAVIAITWDDETAGAIGIAWGVRWTGSTQSVKALMDTIAAYDTRLTIGGSTSFISSMQFVDSELGLNLQDEGWWWYNWQSATGVAYQSGGITYDMVQNGDFVDWMSTSTADVMLYAEDPDGGEPSDPVVPGCSPIVLDGSNSFLENFDALVSGTVPECWSTTHVAGSGTELWGAYSATVASTHSGSRTMRLPDMQSGNITLLVSRAFDVPADAYQLSLWVKRTDAYTNKANEGVKVWVNSTPDTVGGTLLFHARRSITQAPVVSSAGWYEYTSAIPLSGTIYIIMEGISEYGDHTHIDDFSIERIPTCEHPSDLVYDPATISVSWTAGNATQWQVRDGALLTVVDTPYYSNPNWQPATAYTVDVRSICGVGDTNEWLESISFITPRVVCMDTMTIPFSTSFTGYNYERSPYYAGAPLPDCWDVYSNGTNVPEEGSTSNSYYSGIGVASSVNNFGCVTPNDPYFAFIAYGNYDGTYSTYTNNVARYGTRKFAVLPKFNVPLNQLSLSFDYSMSARSGAELRIGYIVNDTSDFTSLYVVPTSYRSKVHVDRLDFATLSDSIPTNARLAMLWLTTDTAHTGSAPSNYFCGIDNLSVEMAPTCKYPRNLVVDTVGYHEFTLSWRDYSVPAATQWQVAYGPMGFDPETEGSMTMVSAPSATVTGLVADNDYEAYVRTMCGSDSYSEWAGPVSMHTVCPNGGLVALGNEELDNFTVSFANYGSTLCQSVFTADELAAAGLRSGDTITNLTYNWRSSTGTRKAKAFSIYMTHTTLTEFPDVCQATDWLPVADSNLVFSDSLTTTATGLTRYDLTTPFVWNGTEGIAITTFVNQPTGVNQNTTGAYAVSSSSANRRTLFVRHDNMTYSLSSLANEAPGSSTYRANILIQRPCIDTLADTTIVNPPAPAEFTMDSIRYWIGNGPDSAMVVVQFDEEEVALAWGLRFDAEEDWITVEDAFDTIAAVDPRFTFSASHHMSGYTMITSVAYDEGDLHLASSNTSANCVQFNGTMVNGDEFEDYFLEENGDRVDLSTGCYFTLEDITAVLPPADTTVHDTTPQNPVDATIAFEDILYWVGQGSDSAVFIVNYAQPDTAFAWGYLFNGTVTAEQMVNNLAAADPRLTVSGTPSMGGDIRFALTTGDTLGLSPVDPAIGYNFWWTNINGVSADAGAGTTLHNGDVFKYGDLNSATGWDYIPYGYYLQQAWTTAPTPVTVPDTTQTPADTTQAPVEATIAASDILFWVGSGEKQAILAVNWADTALAWGFRFSGTATVADMMDSVATADPRFSYVGTSFLSDILYIDTAAGMTDTLRITPGNYWGSTNNGVVDAGMGQTLQNGDFEKWGDPAAGVVVDSTYWGDDWGWGYTYAYPMTITPVTVPETTQTPADTTQAPVEATIAASDILFWVGSGEKQAILAVNWADTALAWGFRFSGTATVADMMDSVATADPRFSYVGTGFLSDILYIDTAAGMTDTLRITPGNYWGSTNNGVVDAGMGQTLQNGDFEKWGDPAAGVVVDSTYWGDDWGWGYTYAYPMTITPVTVPDTTSHNPGPVEPEQGPFCGAVGTEGCNAIAADSNAIVAWASSCTVELGPQNISLEGSPLVTYGSADMATGPVDIHNNLNVVSLGDGGSATLSFATPIANGNGPDFAVFENSFDDYFLELAFVEVSSDGERFVRFPATSLTQTATQVANHVDPTFINNLAGKFRAGYGTPFDLDELRDSTGINVDSIVYVRIIDVVGSIDPAYATYDAFGHMVNDPWPTNSYSSGFDLDGVAVLNERSSEPQGIGDTDEPQALISLYPNPTADVVTLTLPADAQVQLFDQTGRLLASFDLRQGSNTLNLADYPAGIYMLRTLGTVTKVVKR